MTIPLRCKGIPKLPAIHREHEGTGLVGLPGFDDDEVEIGTRVVDGKIVICQGVRLAGVVTQTAEAMLIPVANRIARIGKKKVEKIHVFAGAFQMQVDAALGGASRAWMPEVERPLRARVVFAVPWHGIPVRVEGLLVVVRPSLGRHKDAVAAAKLPGVALALVLEIGEFLIADACLRVAASVPGPAGVPPAPKAEPIPKYSGKHAAVSGVS